LHINRPCHKGRACLRILTYSRWLFINIIFTSAFMNGAISEAYQQAKENYVSNIVILPALDEKYITQVQ
jgi:hypothetical protein